MIAIGPLGASKVASCCPRAPGHVDAVSRRLSSIGPARQDTFGLIQTSVCGGRGAYGDFGGIHVRGCFDQLTDCTGDVERLKCDSPVSAHGVQRLFMGDGRRKRAFHDPGIDAGDPDLRALLAEAVRDRPHGELGGAIDRGRWDDVECSYGADVNDLAALLCFHDWQYSADAPKHAFDVYIDHALPFVQLAGSQRGEGHHASVVYQGVDPTPSIHGGLHEVSHRLAIGYVQCPAFGGTPGVADFGGNGLGAIQPTSA